MDGLNEAVELSRFQEARFAACASADVNDSNTIVSIEDCNAVLWANREPMSQRFALAREQRMQDERGKCEVIDPIDLTRNFKLLRIVIWISTRTSMPRA